MQPKFSVLRGAIFHLLKNLRLNVARSDGYKVQPLHALFSAGGYRPERFTGALMPNITPKHYLPEDVSLWPRFASFFKRRRGDALWITHAGRSGWLLYGRGLAGQRLTQYFRFKLGAAMVIVAASVWRIINRSFVWRRR